MTTRVVFGTLVTLLWAVSAHGAQFEFQSGQKISIDLPGDWSATRTVGNDDSLDVLLQCAAEKRLTCKMSVLVAPPPADERLLDPEKLRTTVALIAQMKGISARPSSLTVIEGIGVWAYDKGGMGMAMITPVKGISITFHFSRVKDFEQLQRIMGSVRVVSGTDA